MAESVGDNHTLYEGKILIAHGYPTIFMCVLRKMKNGKFKLCGFQTSNAEQMEKHMSICETQPYPVCQYCLHEFASKNSLRLHQQKANYCKIIQERYNG